MLETNSTEYGIKMAILNPIFYNFFFLLTLSKTYVFQHCRLIDNTHKTLSDSLSYVNLFSFVYHWTTHSGLILNRFLHQYLDGIGIPQKPIQWTVLKKEIQR